MSLLTADNLVSTIVACATPITASAISVIRISGPKALQLLEELTGAVRPPQALLKRYTLDTGRIKDGIMAAAFYAPKSYTGEDCVELYTHGSPVVVRSVLDYCICHGARIAEGGEFTKRAYLNGKTDLSAAEGVNDIIHAETEAQVNAAYSIADGFLFRRCKSLSDRIVKIAATFQAGLDYPEEGVSSPDKEEAKRQLRSICEELKTLTDSYNAGKKLGEGIRVVITGKVNAGKSSLFNALLGDDRAIVDETEGTTRDSIDAVMEYRGLKFVLTDTAGLRETSDRVESKGIDKAKKLLRDADIVIEVRGEKEYDGKEENDASDRIVVRTRLDKGVVAESGEISVSTTDGRGIDDVKAELFSLSESKGIVPGNEVITNLRHYTALVECLNALTELLCNYDGLTEDIVTLHLRDALDGLSKITGLIGSDEVLNEVFSSFCVGK